MARTSTRNRNARRASGPTKYDAHQSVLTHTYGALAALRRELSDSKATVAERDEILRNFAVCPDPQRSWLLLEDYFEKLSLSRRDFPETDWWPKLLAAENLARLEQLAFLFLKARRPPPTELAAYANSERFAQAQAAERERELIQHLETWLLPHAPAHLDEPRASLRVVCAPQPLPDQPHVCQLAVRFILQRQRMGEKPRTLQEVVDLTTRATHEEELFPASDWEFIRWLADTHSGREDGGETYPLSELDLLHWLARWGHTAQLEAADGPPPYQFHGQVADLVPHLELSLIHI